MSEARVATELEIVAVVGELSDAFPQVNVTDRTIKVYVEDLADLPIEALRLAARKCRTDSKWFPSIAELRAAALALVVGQPGRWSLSGRCRKSGRRSRAIARRRLSGWRRWHSI